MNQSDEYGNTKLMKSIANGDYECTNRLIKAGADVNQTNEDGFTVLLLTSNCGADKCVKVLVEAGADVNAGTLNGWTPLMISARHGHPMSVGELIKSGADVNAWKEDVYTEDDKTKDIENLKARASTFLLAEETIQIYIRYFLKMRSEPRKFTALIIAAFQGNVDCVRHLINAGADVNSLILKAQML